MVQAQFDSLSKLHAALDGRQIDGWQVSVPRPLYICKSPLALVMTEVPGKHIDLYASKSHALTSKTLLDASRAFVTAMQLCWSDGRRHGDLEGAQRPFRCRGQEDLVHRRRDPGKLPGLQHGQRLTIADDVRSCPRIVRRSP